MKIYKLSNNTLQYVYDDTLYVAVKIADNDIMLRFFHDCNIVFEKHYSSWKACNIAISRLSKKFC